MSMTFDEWLQYGLTQGWNGPPVCSVHDGIPTTAEEDAGWEQGADDCIYVLRMYQDEATKKAVEENHSPSVWRATNDGYTL
jgi:hypothetical protein